jgi:D-glycero-D-manno-heptose 1,7-bisphosphate phosphatase
MSARAVFLDRDGTLVQPRHYPSDARDLALCDDVGPELHHLQRAGFRLVVITNQSGIARGYFSEADVQIMHQHLRSELARFGVTLDAIYHCPHHVNGVIPELAISCPCRKPQPGMLLRAADDLGLALAQSWLVGDTLDDVEAGKRAGCRTILVDLATQPTPIEPTRRPDFVARSTSHALRIVRAVEHLGPHADLSYMPSSWSTEAPGGAAAAWGGIHASSH